MSFDLHAHEKKMNDKLDAENRAKAERENKLNEIAIALKEQIFKYAANVNESSKVAQRENIIIIQNPTSKMTISVRGEDDYSFMVEYAGSRSASTRNPTYASKDQMMTSVVNYIRNCI